MVTLHLYEAVDILISMVPPVMIQRHTHEFPVLPNDGPCQPPSLSFLDGYTTDAIKGTVQSVCSIGHMLHLPMESDQDSSARRFRYAQEHISHSHLTTPVLLTNTRKRSVLVVYSFAPFSYNRRFPRIASGICL